MEPKKAKERGPAVGGQSAKVDTQLDDGVSGQDVTKLLQSAHDILQRCPEAFQARVARAKWQIKKESTAEPMSKVQVVSSGTTVPCHPKGTNTTPSRVQLVRLNTWGRLYRTLGLQKGSRLPSADSRGRFKDWRMGY